ncbi:MAG: hypothetical protein U9O86_02425 [Campylobacterota bacterium]|nr:hypothetical protein [Campylobacterota bacterium]
MNKILLLLSFLFIGFSNLMAKDISTYLIGDYVDTKTASKQLQDAGFEIISEYSSVKNGVTLVFTNEALKSEGAKSKRAHGAILRLFIDNKEKMISFTNPVYFGKAFMQDDYNPKVYEAQLASINKAFTGLKGSVDKLDEDDISDYNFMMGMPNYEDSDSLGEGSTAELLKKAQDYKKGKLHLFTLKLSNDSYLVGYDLGKRTKKFVKKIGRANAAVLPYCISIEKGEATSLEAKYYLALSYPLLTMTKFTTIATVPGAIKKDLAKPFK